MEICQDEEMRRIRTELAERFRYTSDSGRIDKWVITTHGGLVRDDCDGWALTLLYELAGKSWLRFWWLLITFQATIWYAKSYRNQGHAILWYRGWWSDNMEHRWYRTENMRHKRRFPFLFPLVALKLLIGKLL